MSNPLISVIVPIYKVELYLDRCVQSIVGQTYQNLEIILVDDGSPDTCPAICDSWAARDSRIKVFHKKNGGLSSARNAGLDICQGEYVAFVDSDDWVEADMYEALLQACNDQNTMISVCGRYVVSADGKYIDKCYASPASVSSTDFTARMFVGDCCDSSACDKLFSKSLWDNVRFPDGRIYEDVAIMYRVVLNSERVAIVNRPLYNYYRHGGSITKSVISSHWFDYPLNTRNLLNDIVKRYPELYEHACWTHTKALQNVIDKIARAERTEYKSYLSDYKRYCGELRSLRAVWKGSKVFSSYDRRMCSLYSIWYIARPLCKIKRVLKAIKRI